MKATEGIGRAFFCSMINREVIILHEIIKKTQKTPPQDILLASKRLIQWGGVKTPSRVWGRPSIS